ncbi:MAG: hydratase [Lachnospiraceae bacterium]|nr:hydratase [Lachnospiraceae bacterium]
MIRLIDEGVYLKNGALVPAKDASGCGTPAEGAKKTLSYRILSAHNKSGNDRKLNIRFDALTSHDITYVGIIQTARASGLTEFPMPYVLTNCHNSLCAVGGTINEDDHVFGLTCAQKYGGIYVPPHLAVIHQYAREMLSGCGRMVLGSDSHTRYGALGTMAVGEGGPELVKQLLNQTYDINMPDVVAVYLHGTPRPGVGPQDVAIALVGAVFANGFVKNKVLEFVGPGIRNLSPDFRIGIDVMTTETTCLSSIWETDEKVEEFFEIHGRPEAYQELHPEDGAYYSSAVDIDLSLVEPMIALPFHPSNAYSIRELYENLDDILHETEERARVSFGEKVPFTLRDKVHNGKLYVEQGVIAGCAGGGFENLCAAADILEGKSIGSGEFSLSIYPASQPVYIELVRNGSIARFMETGATVRTAFCGPCFGAGDVPSNNGLSIRHSTRNFPNREGSKVQNGQIASVALMDARSIAATAANEGVLTAATDLDITYKNPKYFFDKTIYEKRVYDGWGSPKPETEIRRGPNIVDWPAMSPLSENLIMRVVSEIHDPVTTTDELIPSGETSSYRSNPLGLAEYTLSRKDPAYVGRAKEVRTLEELRANHALGDKGDPSLPCPGVSDKEFGKAVAVVRAAYPHVNHDNFLIGSTIYAIKPGDGSAREQAASCQRVLGGIANIAREYATKRYRSNLINWGMIPFRYEGETLPFKNLDYIFVPDVKKAVHDGLPEVTAYVIDTEESKLVPFTLKLDEMTAEEKEIIEKGCLINYNRQE